MKERRWRGVPTLTDRQRALCEVAEKLSGTPTRMVEDDWQSLRELGLGDEGCLEVAHIVGMFNHLTRLADGFGLRLDDQTAAAADNGEALPPLRPE